jgi:hypothetical protein
LPPPIASDKLKESAYTPSINAEQRTTRDKSLELFEKVEKEFVANLLLVVEKFMRPYQATKLIGKADVKMIFSEIPTLLSTHNVRLLFITKHKKQNYTLQSAASRC